MTDSRVYELTVTLEHDTRRSVLLSLASVLHRRGVHVVEASLGQPLGDRRTFRGRVDMSPHRIDTLIATFRNEIGVLTAEYAESADLPGHARNEPHLPRHHEGASTATVPAPSASMDR